MDDMTLAQLRGVPLLFTYRQTAAGAAGVYNFTSDTTAKAFTPDRPIAQTILYIVKTMSIAMDISPEDYVSAIDRSLRGVLPEFSMYVQSEGGAPALREPLVLSRYFERLPYLLPIIGKDLLTDAYPGASAAPTAQGFNQNRLLGLVSGTLAQTASLLGKASVTAVLSFTVHEITDQELVAAIQGKNQNGGAAGRVYE